MDSYIPHRNNLLYLDNHCPEYNQVAEVVGLKFPKLIRYKTYQLLEVKKRYDNFSNSGFLLGVQAIP